MRSKGMKKVHTRNYGHKPALTEAELWARKRNWLLARLGSAKTVFSSDELNMIRLVERDATVDSIIDSIKLIITKLRKVNTFKKYNALLIYKRQEAENDPTRNT